ncbi:RWD domain-containing protein 1 isoform X1 [Apis mellifera caucasica]|uniref:RWD domain-containing protein 1 isoform X1 n=1 Tax=Apis mellifera TaxID=7460 RepID=A0A7M7R3W4_APIME|nr:RWD domain-containing protein 1 isoform X1 [Apis mellifera]KAG6800806.1 RWD domain-containing protein 1 isoform X1 [Apis mellifera caucasica]KAG9428475.1 RWD domain-containing protein 1 isoform X1 [Apis mellifera carnica]|eukprot:XP_393179.1 RWD domain-containing protein 1 isoform X1 [Apis mellifera]
MDYKDEQLNEIEALESIYCGELEVLATEPFYTFSIPIKTEEYESGTENGLSCCLQFTYTEKYPDEPLLISIEEPENFEEESSEKLKKHLIEQMSENLGMVMVFTLVSAAQEWLNVQWDKIKLNREECEAQKLREEEEAERRKFEGTRVTVETFLCWKEKFDEEMGYTKRREIAEREGKKLTGRELFMTDKTLDQSDLKFLDDDSVKVDESLFQNLDDLDLEDEDDDDADYEPNVSDDSA